MKVVAEKTVFGQTMIASITTASGDQGARVLQVVGAGKPFWAWPSLPPGRVIGADFDFGTGFSWGDGAPKCATTAAENNLILAELASIGPAPEDVLTWET